MGRVDWSLITTPNKTERSNVMITITDNAAVVEGETVTAVCNNKTFTSVMKDGVAKLYTSEVGTYMITVGEYSTMLVCPYFGVFSTDIYSGVLVVKCVEEGGNNKTCHVQSCDDEFYFTDNYNLTQTFDPSLKLTFLGIPPGKYLITVDERYRFFKEIGTIQNINETDVELKQWLYKAGDQCEWNTGGWMQCLAASYPAKDYNGNYSNSTQSVSFISDRMRLQQTCTAKTCMHSGSTYNYASRPAIGSAIYCGTKKQISLDISKYQSLMFNASQTITKAFRVGEPNNTNTSTATATVLTSSTANQVPIQVALKSICYLVIGNEVHDPGVNSYKSGKVNIDYNYSFSCDIMEIYLV